jgi:hypothetical protein
MADLRRYVDLISAFVGRKIEAGVFESEYLHAFKNDPTDWPEDSYQVLDGLFGDVDAFSSDRDLRNADGLDEEQLRTKAAVALERLKRL